DRLEPGRSIQLDVECRAESASASACGRVTVTAQEGPREEAVTCVKIEAAAGDGAGAGGVSGAAAERRGAIPLVIEVSSSGDPVKVGDEISYVVTVGNPSDRGVSGTVLQMTMPTGMSAPRAIDANPARPQ